MVSFSALGQGLGQRPEPMAPGEDLLGALLTYPRPVLIDYQQERTELSGRVLMNWAVKATHLFDGLGLDDSQTVAVDIPVNWLSTGVVLGAVWTSAELVFVAENTSEEPDTDFILTDRPAFWENSVAQLLTLGAEDVAPDPNVTAVETDISAQADQPFLPKPDLMGHYPAPSLSETPGSAAPSEAGRGTLRRAQGMLYAASGQRFSEMVLGEMIETFRRFQPVVLVDRTAEDFESLDAELQALIHAENL